MRHILTAFVLALALAGPVSAQTKTVTFQAPAKVATVQCTATTKAGAQCKRRVKPPAKGPALCWQHDGSHGPKAVTK